MKILFQSLVIVATFAMAAYFGVNGPANAMWGTMLLGTISLFFLNIERIAKFKFSKDGFEAEMFDRVQAVIEKETQPDSDIKISPVTAEGYAVVGHDAPKVIKVLLGTDYTWRYASGICKDSGVPREKVRETLDWLARNKLARTSEGKTGQIWALTRKGRDVFAASYGNDSGSLERQPA